MKRLVQTIIASLLCGLLINVIANERSTGAASYDATGSTPEITETGIETSAIAGLHNYQASDALLRLRADWDTRYRSLEAALLLAVDNDTRDALELQLMTLQADAQRAELELLLTEALADGNQNYAIKLQDVLDHGLQPTHSPLPAVRIQRDPVTGKALTGEEGGVK